MSLRVSILGSEALLRWTVCHDYGGMGDAGFHGGADDGAIELMMDIIVGGWISLHFLAVVSWFRIFWKAFGSLVHECMDLVVSVLLRERNRKGKWIYTPSARQGCGV